MNALGAAVTGFKPARGALCPTGYTMTRRYNGPNDLTGYNWCVYTAPPPSPARAPAPAPAPAPVIDVNPSIQTNVSPQISPVFQQQFQPKNSPESATTAQIAPSSQTSKNENPTGETNTPGIVGKRIGANPTPQPAPIAAPVITPPQNQAPVYNPPPQPLNVPVITPPVETSYIQPTQVAQPARAPAPQQTQTAKTVSSKVGAYVGIGVLSLLIMNARKNRK